MQRYTYTGLLKDIKEGLRKSILGGEHFDFVDEKIESDNEVTALETWF